MPEAKPFILPLTDLDTPVSMWREGLRFIPAAAVAVYAGIILIGGVAKIHEQATDASVSIADHQTEQGLLIAGTSVATVLGSAYATRHSRRFIATARTWNFNKEVASVIRTEMSAN